VDGLPLSATGHDLNALVLPVTSPEGVRLVCDHTGRSLRFGFLFFTSDKDARAAEAALTGTALQGCTLRIGRVPMTVRSAHPLVQRAQNAA
jgi:hypothetical protein